MNIYIDKNLPLPSWVLLIPCAAFMTLLMFAFMAQLISMVEVDINDVEDALPLPPIHFEERDLVTYKNTKPVKPIEPTLPPELPSAPPESSQYATPKIEFNKYKPNKFKTSMYGSSPMPIATVQVGAKYPTRALIKGIEGFVDVRFDVTAYGTTENIRVISAKPASVFDRAAIAAVKRWKFQPATYNGTPQGYQGLTNRIRFEIQK